MLLACAHRWQAASLQALLSATIASLCRPAAGSAFSTLFCAELLAEASSVAAVRNPNARVAASLCAALEALLGSVDSKVRGLAAIFSRGSTAHISRLFRP